MAGYRLAVLGRQGGQLAREFAKTVFGVTQAKRAGLLQGGEGFVDAGQRLFVGLDVEIFNGMADKLH